MRTNGHLEKDPSGVVPVGISLVGTCPLRYAAVQKLSMLSSSPRGKSCRANEPGKRDELQPRSPRRFRFASQTTSQLTGTASPGCAPIEVPHGRSDACGESFLLPTFAAPAVPPLLFPLRSAKINSVSGTSTSASPAALDSLLSVPVASRRSLPDACDALCWPSLQSSELSSAPSTMVVIGDSFHDSKAGDVETGL